MARWCDVEAEAPELASAIEGRITAHIHHVMGTIRADGSPRLSGTEARFFDGDLWLGCMPTSWKAKDLRRDPRVALHTAPLDAEMVDGDAKLSGRAFEVTDPDRMLGFFISIGHAEPGDDPIDPEAATAFTIDLTTVSLAKVVVDHMEITTWLEGRGVSSVSVQ